MSVTVYIENHYEDGHHSTHDVIALAPAGDLAAWWEEVVYPYTGDGHGIGTDLGSVYTATITKADDPQLVGEQREWTD